MPQRILVINDSEEILALFQDLLNAEGYEVAITSYSPRMLDEIKQTNPDLIILDYMIGREAPGWELVQKLRLDPATARMPVLICSGAIRRLQDMEGWLTEKGIGVVFKPFDIEDLLHAVHMKLDDPARSGMDLVEEATPDGPRVRRAPPPEPPSESRRPPSASR